mmetsp:Transcript_33752/g.65189  ORF Transcript_33752/g.65189 Transcript_33752/m.65189 type:complete len:476 (+) Transcript_33752:72-1499(+)
MRSEWKSEDDVRRFEADAEIERRPSTDWIFVSHQFTDTIFTSYSNTHGEEEKDFGTCCCYSKEEKFHFQQEQSDNGNYSPKIRPNGLCDRIRTWFGGREGHLAATLTVHVSLVIYAFCYQISHVLLPYIAEHCGMETVEYGALIAIFCTVQLVGGVLYGRAGDVFGSKTMLVVAHLAGVISYSMMSFASTKTVLFASEIPGLLQHGMQGSNMLIANMSNDRDRIKALGRLGFSYGLGATVGPLVVAQMHRVVECINRALTPLSKLICGRGFEIWSGEAAMLWFCNNPSLKATMPICTLGRMCVASTTLMITLVMIVVPSKNRQGQERAEEKKLLKKQGTAKKLRNVFSLTELLRLQRYKYVRRLLLAKFGILFPSALFMAMFAQFCVAEFHFTPERTGRLLSYVPFVRMVGQGLLVNPLVRHFPEAFVIRMSCFVVAFSMVLVGNATTELDLYLTLLPLNLGGAVRVPLKIKTAR